MKRKSKKLPWMLARNRLLRVIYAHPDLLCELENVPILTQPEISEMTLHGVPLRPMFLSNGTVFSPIN